MNLFTALELDTKVIANLTELVHRLRPCGAIHWSHPQNMHLTLKYIGDWEVHRVDVLVRALQSVNVPPSLSVPLAGLGFFPNSRHPKVFWAGAENTPALRRLASSVDSELQMLGIAPEIRPYFPHLTLGRVVEDAPLDELYRSVEDLPSREFGAISPDRFVLFESILMEGGSIYRKVAEFPFTNCAKPADESETVGSVVAGRW